MMRGKVSLVGSRNLISRRHALLAGAGIIPAMSRRARAGSRSDLQIIILADMHSAYERMAQLLAGIDSAIAATPSVARLVVINGDIFERGNVVALRSQGSVDWGFVEALARRAPVVLNLGNHDADITLDLAATVSQARGLGVKVLSNIVDARSGAPYADAYITMRLGARKVTIVALGVSDLYTYPKEVRPAITVPSAPEWLSTNLPGMLQGGSFNLILSHAGVVPDKQILPLLPDGTLLVGGHDHLLFQHAQGGTRYLHMGSWNRGFAVATVSEEAGRAAIVLRQVDVALEAPKDAALARLIEAALAKHLTDEERAIIGRSNTALSLDETGREVSRIMAAAKGGAVGLVGHTTFGTGLPAGEVTKYAFDAVIRFEGDLMSADVNADTLSGIYGVANQDRDMPLAARTGDYVYANPVEVIPDKTYRLVTNDWTAKNQKSYLGRSDIAFQPIAGAKLKPTVIAALPG
jgi:2',3'-cyclic-nucleotide 2'-phosphodiesterase (5'-nucleotidase family)